MQYMTIIYTFRKLKNKPKFYRINTKNMVQFLTGQVCGYGLIVLTFDIKS